MSEGRGAACLAELKRVVEAGQPKYTERLVLQALEAQIRPSRILHEALIPAIHSVGDYYRSDESDIPQILLSARCMKTGFLGRRKKTWDLILTQRFFPIR